MAQVKHRRRTTQDLAATSSREFRTFLLMAQFEAREIGARIQQARKERGLSQEELAEMASFSKRSLQDYETGETIPYRHFRELGRLLDKQPEWFLYGDRDRDDGADRDDAELRELVRDEVATLLGPLTEAIERVERRLAALPGPPADAADTTSTQ